MARGRKPNSLIRNRMQSIVDTLGVTYGYEIYRLYREVFEPIDLRSIYYHLAKGMLLGEFEEVGIKEIQGKFTWGSESTRKYYLLGPRADNHTSAELSSAARALGLGKKAPKDFVEWDDVVKAHTQDLRTALEKVRPKSKEARELVEKVDNLLGWFEKNGCSRLIDIKNIKRDVEQLVKK